jgi:hypothetical protein
MPNLEWLKSYHVEHARFGGASREFHEFAVGAISSLPDFERLYFAACGALRWGFDPLTNPVGALEGAVTALAARVHELEAERVDYLERLRTQAAAAKLRIETLEAAVARLEKPRGIVVGPVDVSVRKNAIDPETRCAMCGGDRRSCGHFPGHP